MNTHKSASIVRKPAGIIDTLSVGFGAVSRRLWLLLLPVALDLYFWLGPRLSIQPFFDRFADQLATAPTAGLSPDMAEQLPQMLDTIRMLGASFNLFSLLAAQGLGLPSLLADSSLLVVGGQPAAITLTSGLQALLLSLLLAVAGLLVAALWLGLVARAVRPASGQQAGASFTLGQWLRRGLVHGARFLLIGLLVFALSLAIVPAMTILGLVMMFSPGLGVLLMTLLVIGLLWVGLWLTIHFYFVAEAVVLNNAGPLRALSQSFHVVGRNFWSALAFIVLVFVINAGLGVIWSNLARSTVGLLVAILGNAFIGTSLCAATFVFFADRYQLWQRQRAEGMARPSRA